MKRPPPSSTRTDALFPYTTRFRSSTAPEISQMFGEMIGIWIADLWSRAGRPAFRYVELGPGRGTLAADALRVMARFDCAPQGVHLVETSPTLRAAQLARLPAAEHHDETDALPDDTPLLILPTEFFDSLPIPPQNPKS